MIDVDSVAALASDAELSNFSDPRLRARLATVTRKLAANPALSFPKVFSSAELEGAYRFFGNPRVTTEGILSGHFERTRGSCDREPSTLVIHDTSTFSFAPDGAREGLGRVRRKGQAFFAHVSLALSDDGRRRPLGLASLTTWTRGERPAHDERARWWQSVQMASSRLGGTCKIVHIMDREADDYALFARLTEAHHAFVIRLAHNRILAELAPSEPKKLSDAIAKIECVVQREASISKRVDGERSPVQKHIHPSRGKRTATLSVGATTAIFKRPRTQDRALPETLSLHVVRVWEQTPLPGEAPIEWLLVTNVCVDSTDAIVRTVERYRARWTIEEYFKALKTGCAFPDRQLGDYEGLINALAVFAPIACRLLALRSYAQHDPLTPASSVLEDDEIQVLRVLGRIPLPPAPSARDVLLAVASLGGHIKWSGEPGWLTIGRGYAELELLTRGWRAAKLQRDCDQG